MNTSPFPFHLPDTAPELARRFAVIMAGLAALVARRFLRMPHLVGLTTLLWSRLNRAVRRFHRALTSPARVHAPRKQAEQVRPRQARPSQVQLPLGRGWIVRELGWEAAGYMAQLDALLREVANRTALADAPAAARVLRPICRMLGVAVMPEIASTPAIAVAVVQHPAVQAGVSLDKSDFIAGVPERIFSGN
ncbi:MAG: hypothetical protein H7251_00640 [Acetobacteraceae bacterium]|nr:hypothetical protein [Acetobacteraceae bacterium]